MPQDAKRDGPQAGKPQAPAQDERAPDAQPETASDDVSAEDPDGGPAEAAAAEGQGDEPGRTEQPEVIEAVGELIEEGPAEQLAEAQEEAGRDLEAELAKAQGDSERHLDDLRRLKADFENYRKRVLREQTIRAQSASQALVTRLLPVLDHFELAMTALKADEGAGDLDKMRQGVEMVLGELRDVLRSEGLEPIEAEGKPFDPQRHEAVASVEAEDTEPGTVVGVVRAGYELHGRVIRPAMVRVAQ